MIAGSSESALYIAEYRRHSTMSTAQAALVSDSGRGDRYGAPIAG
jgi:hypothetical protein